MVFSALPVLAAIRFWWAHYSDKHRGICLGFDADNNECEEMQCKEIHYVHERIPWVKPDLEFMKKLLFTKFDGWKYEQEIRCFARREIEENDLYFFPFGDKLRLREVIIGHRCCTERSEISAALARYSEPVEIFVAYLSNGGFKVLKNAGDISK
jgi:hypothetical protein